MDNELILFDRLEIIKTINKEYDLENKGYISFSGGKDSTVLHYLIDMALPNNKIPRVFINTGIEYNDIVSYVKELQKNDDRIFIIPPKNIKQVLEKYGYPFKSKQHSHYVSIYQHSKRGQSVNRYLGIIESTTKFRCPKALMYQFTDNFKLKISEQCCNKLKKEPFKNWEKKHYKSISILGLRMEEGGQRQSHKGCVVFDSKDKNKINKFKPLNPLTDEWIDWFIQKYEIKLCKLYYPPFNFKRTGCKGCPFALELQNQLDVMEQLLPNEKKQCEIIWKPVYEEYRRINYRLKKDIQLKLF